MNVPATTGPAQEQLGFPSDELAAAEPFVVLVQVSVRFVMFGSPRNWIVTG
jgi:hypothetical protein